MSNPTNPPGTDNGNQAKTELALQDLIEVIDGETRTGAGFLPTKGSGLQIAPSVNEDKAGTQYLRFLLGETWLAVPLSAVSEIGVPPEVTSLPNLPEWLLGVCNIRGEVVSMCDLKRFFNWQETATVGVKKKFLVLSDQKIKAGVIVDRVMGLINVEQEAFATQNDGFLASDPIVEYLKGVVALDGGTVLIMDPEKLLGSSQFSRFQN